MCGKAQCCALCKALGMWSPGRKGEGVVSGAQTTGKLVEAEAKGHWAHGDREVRCRTFSGPYAGIHPWRQTGQEIRGNGLRAIGINVFPQENAICVYILYKIKFHEIYIYMNDMNE